MFSRTSFVKLKKTRRLNLISLDWTRPKDPPLSLGQASILANLKQHNIETIPYSWAVNTPYFSFKTVFEAIMNHASPNTDVAFGAFVWNEKAIQSILNLLKQYHYPGRIILGGPQVSYVKKGLEALYPQADIFIRGYAEDAIAKLMVSESLKPEIKGVHYAGEVDTGTSATVDLERLPSPYLMGLIKPQRFIRWETQRGCPFRCAFCQHRESDATMQRRQLSLSRVLQEAVWITKNPIIRDVAVLDPTFNLGPYYLQTLDKLIEGKFSGKLSLQCRIEMVKKDFLDRVTELNKTGETVLEFGLQTIQPEEQKIIDRPNNMKKIEEILTGIRERKIKSEISLIFGLPGQTVASFKQSVDFCIKQKTPIIHAFPLMLLRGTPLYHRKKELGLIESNEMASPEIDRVQTDIPHVVASPSFSYADWKKMAKIAESLEKYNKENMDNEDHEMAIKSETSIKGIRFSWQRLP